MPDQSSPTPMPLPDRRAFLWKLLDRYDVYIGSTINRAAAVTALNTLIVGYVILKAGDILPAFRGHSKLRLAAFGGLGVAGLAALVSTFLSFVALVPYLGSAANTGRSLIFFKDVASRKRSAFKTEVVSISDESAEGDLAEQVHDVASGLNKKFVWLTRAAWATLLALASMLVLGASVLISTLIDLRN